MSFRFPAITAAIFLFCGIMTWLHVRSVLWPAESKLAEVSPRAVLELFASRAEASELDIYEAGRIIGECRVTPQSGLPAQGNKYLRPLQLAISWRLRIARGPFKDTLMDVSSQFSLSPAGEVRSFWLKAGLSWLRERFEIEVAQPAGTTWPGLKLIRGHKGEVLFSTAAGHGPDTEQSMLIGVMLAAAGLPPETLGTIRENAMKDAAAVQITARSGRMEAGPHRFDGYLVTSGRGDDGDAGFRIYFANTGEVLRLDTPLGLQMLARSFRPKDAVLPDLLGLSRPDGPATSAE